MPTTAYNQVQHKLSLHKLNYYQANHGRQKVNQIIPRENIVFPHCTVGKYLFLGIEKLVPAERPGT
jgi:hypothetical protein